MVVYKKCLSLSRCKKQGNYYKWNTAHFRDCTYNNIFYLFEMDYIPVYRSSSLLHIFRNVLYAVSSNLIIIRELIHFKIECHSNVARTKNVKLFLSSQHFNLQQNKHNTATTYYLNTVEVWNIIKIMYQTSKYIVYSPYYRL